MISRKTERRSHYFIGLFILLSSTLIPVILCQAYTMPAEQIVQFMADNFSRFQTLVITQSTQLRKEEDEEGRVFREKVWMKSPNFFHSEVLDKNMVRDGLPDFGYRQLLIGNGKERLIQILSWMGINIRSVAFTRFNGIIAYRIGDKDVGSPKIFLEKDRFLPLLLKYRSLRENSDQIITVRFKDYRKHEKGWFPYEIIYSPEEKMLERYMIDHLQVNVPIDPSLFVMSGIKFRSADPSREKHPRPLQEERIREIIKNFEEKYGH